MTDSCVSPLGTLLTLWTIRLSLAAYAAWLANWLVHGEDGERPPFAWRWCYTLGCALAVAHVACALGFYHGFRHASAAAETSRQTEEVLGFRFAAGLYFNYLFVLLWMIDGARQWLAPRPLPAWVLILLHVYMTFLAFNGAVIFASGPARWIGLAAAAALAAVATDRLASRTPLFRNRPSTLRTPQ
jgi:hypothetical protein